MPVSIVVYRDVHKHLLRAFSPVQCSRLSGWGADPWLLLSCYSLGSLKSTGQALALSQSQSPLPVSNWVWSHSPGDC